jgi:gluconolactonase
MLKTYWVVLVTLLVNTIVYGQAHTGSIERKDAALDAIIDAQAKVEIIADGFDWSEGPLWLEKQQMLLFSDVPQNIIYKWTAKKGREIYLTPSGYTGTAPRGGEKGSNGLTLNNKGQLVICQHGDRRMAIMNAALEKPTAVFTTISNNYQGKKFNSPNDAVYNSKGDLFFTDPPYGLEKNMDDPLKEIPFQGIYKVTKAGGVVLLTDSVTRPNGIAITPDQKTLIIANSDPDKPYWYAFDFGAGDALIHPRIFYDATEAAKTEQGMPDGLKIDTKGNVFATGPGGVWIFNKNGKWLGRIKFDGLTSNCSLSADEKTIYITADMYVLRVVMRK